MNERIDADARITELEQALRRAEEERDKLKSQAPYVEASGHYCDGMSAAWMDAQELVGKLTAAEERNREHERTIARLRERLNENP